MKRSDRGTRRHARLLRAVTALSMLLAAGGLTTLQAKPASAATGATAYKWVTVNSRAVDWNGSALSSSNTAGGERVYGFTSWNNGGGRVKLTKSQYGDLLYAGDGYKSGDGESPRTLYITDPVTGIGQVNNLTWMQSNCDYFGLTYKGTKFNKANQTAYTTDPWKDYPGYDFNSTKYLPYYPWNGNYTSPDWWDYVSAYWDRYTDTTGGTGNVWTYSGVGAWYYACERWSTQYYEAVDTAPVGQLDTPVINNDGSVELTGWGADRDLFAASRYYVSIDGAIVNASGALTSIARPPANTWLNSSYATTGFTGNYGFDTTVAPAKRGTHTLCVIVANTVPASPVTGGSASNTSLCTSVNTTVAPQPQNDSASTYENTPVDINVLANDVDRNDGSPTFDKVVTNGTYGTATWNAATQMLTYTPNNGVVNSTDTVVYQDKNSAGLTATATVTIAIGDAAAPPYNAGPVSRSDTTTVHVGTTTTIDPIATGTDTVAPASLQLQWPPVQWPAAGTLTVSGNAISYTPTKKGTYTLVYAVCNYHPTYGPVQQCVDDTMTYVVPNEPPSAQPFAFNVKSYTSATIPFASYISDIDGDPLTVTIVTPPAQGTITQSGGVWTYTAGATAGPDTFQYQVTDPDGATSAIVTVTANVTSNPMRPS